MSDSNHVMMQYFHWYVPNDGSLWKQIGEKAEELAAVGISALWLPPADKGTSGGLDMGYGVYDLFDLGEFDQKGSVRTKYGAKDEYIRAIEIAHELGINIYADVVLNPKMGADQAEDVEATPMSMNDRNQSLGDQRTIQAWTNFTFPGRKGKYSTGDGWKSMETGDGWKSMETGSPKTTYTDITEHIQETITTDDRGWADFRCNGGSVSVWVPQG